MDPERGNNEILLTWQCDVTPYTSDLNVYIWEYHKLPPANEHAKIAFLPAQSEEAADRLLIGFRSCRTHMEFVKKRNAKSIFGNVSGSGTMDDQQWSPVSEEFFSLCCVFEVMIEDTASFVNECHHQAYRMVS